MLDPVSVSKLSSSVWAAIKQHALIGHSSPPPGEDHCSLGVLTGGGGVGTLRGFFGKATTLDLAPPKGPTPNPTPLGVRISASEPGGHMFSL